MKDNKTAIIIGAGPAGLTAAYELLTRTDIRPVILEQTDRVGGLSTTVNYKGNRLDIGGHRFFSKSDRVMDWWFHFLPVQRLDPEEKRLTLAYRNRKKQVDPGEDGPDPDVTDRVMLIRNRLSRIFYGRKFYDYPVRLNPNTIRNLGLRRITLIGFSYLKARLKPVKPEKNLEDFFINRFGRELFLTFFKDYTEKVWGVPCNRIKPEWGSQRVKGLSVSKAVWHSLLTIFAKNDSFRQKSTETSLIERFLYPKFGPGHLWQTVTAEIEEMGGVILFNRRVSGLEWEPGRIRGVAFENLLTGEMEAVPADYIFSSMPVIDLISGMHPGVPGPVNQIAHGLSYRDFITIGLLYSKMAAPGDTKESRTIVPDNWIYIQEPDVKVGRIQVFNNWSPFMVKDPETVWLGLEYFCHEGDELWSLPDHELIELGKAELEKMGFCQRTDYLDGTVVRMPKTYPAYFGTYEQFGVIRKFTDSFDNLFLIGRNGMHRYNNQDHSMLTAMTAVDNLVAGITSKENIWMVNTDEDYHEDTAT